VLLNDPSCSSSTITSPRFLNGRKIADLAPMMSWYSFAVSVPATRFHISTFSGLLKREWYIPGNCTKNACSGLNNLGCQGNFGQKVKIPACLFKLFFDKMNINFSLTLDVTPCNKKCPYL